MALDEEEGADIVMVKPAGAYVSFLILLPSFFLVTPFKHSLACLPVFSDPA